VKKDAGGGQTSGNVVVASKNVDVNLGVTEEDGTAGDGTAAGDEKFLQH